MSMASGTAVVELGLVLGLGALLLLVILPRLRRGLPPSPCRRTIRLTAQHSLHVVELDGRAWLVGTGPQQGPTLLTSLARAAATPAEAATLGDGDVVRLHARLEDAARARERGAAD